MNDFPESARAIVTEAGRGLEEAARRAPDGLAGISAYRSLHAEALGRIAALHRSGAGGLEISGLLTDITDLFIRHAFRIHFPDSGEKVPALLALAGYGRRELSPFSDIDLVFVTEADSGDEDPRMGAFLRFLWDLNLDLGHSTRTPAECIEDIREDTWFATSLLESRLIDGNTELDDDVRNRLLTEMDRGFGKTLALKKIGERTGRIEANGGTVQIQTPNVKESPGGLRDIQLIRWLAALSGEMGNCGGASREGILEPEEADLIEGILDFLFRVRNALHFTAGKRTDLLTHVVIPEIARQLGYTGESSRPGERFMRDYYMHAGDVFRLVNRAVGRYMDRSGAVSRTPFVVLPIGIRTNDTHAALFREDSGFLDTHPSLFVELFTVAGAFNLSLTDESAFIVEHAVSRLDDTFPTQPDVRTAFHALLNLRTGIPRAFRLLHEHGVLARLLPEFGAIGWHYQYDYYHAYTTDEHSLKVVEHLENMAAGRFDPFPQMHEVMADVTARGALYLAGLLHDIGKAEGGAHSAQGERLALKALRRLDIDERTIELVRFLIREHLLMSHVTQRRDTDDPETIRDFIGRVGSAGRLRMLTALTFADLSALSPGVLSDWKKALLWSLYTRALGLIEHGYEHAGPPGRDRAVKDAVRKLGGHVSGDVVLSHVNGLPEQYIRVTTPSHVLAHIRGIAIMEKKGAWASFHKRRGLAFLTVITKDYPSALSDICGAITASDIGILAAQIFTRNDGVIIDTFLVAAGDGGISVPVESQRDFKRNLLLVTSGRARAGDLVRSHALRWRRRKKKAVYSPPRVRFDNAGSSEYTVIDIFATDYTGLLYDVTCVFAENGMDIHAARIGTDEDQVADAFYIRKSGGGKIEDEEEQEKLRRDLIARLDKAEARSGSRWAALN